MGIPLLIQYYLELPEPEEGESFRAWERQLQTSLEEFKGKVHARYTEGTLLRLLDHENEHMRRAAALSLGLLGTMTANEPLSLRLHDLDAGVRRIAGDALWNLWFRGDSDKHATELQRLVRLRDREKALVGMNVLIKKAPNFAEAFNQRAILHFQANEFHKAIADCERTLQLNPYHFGAYAGMAQCYMNLSKPRAALRAFRETLKLNPNMQGIEETIRELESVLGEEE